MYTSGKSDPKWKIWKRKRFIIAILISLGLANSSLLRTNMSFAIVAMTKNQTITDNYGNTTFKKDFDWNSKMQGILLSSFYYGYVSSQLLGGWLCSKFGGKRVFGFGIAGSALLTLVVPFATRISYYLLLCLRVLTGLLEGCTLPCMYAIWSQWAPPLEISRLVSISVAGLNIGSIFTAFVGSQITFAFGWEILFYFSGGIPLLWVLAWWILATDSPAQDSSISLAELQYIKSALGNQVRPKKVKPPWKHMLTSTPLLACVVANFSETWVYVTMLIQLPLFMKDVLNFDLGKTGIMSALPNIARLLVTVLTGCMADYCDSKKFLSTTNTRKLFCCSGLFFEALFLVIGSQLMSATGTTLCITIGVALGGLTTGSFGSNYVELAPPYAGIISAIGIFLAMLSGVIGPVLTGFIVTNGSASQWQTVFYISTGISFTSACLYGIFASAERQHWAMTPEPLSLLPDKGSDDNTDEA